MSRMSELHYEQQKLRDNYEPSYEEYHGLCESNMPREGAVSYERRGNKTVEFVYDAGMWVEV